MSESLHIPYIDEGFSVSHADNCHLAIQLIDDNYHLAIFCPKQRLRLLVHWQGADRDARVDHFLGLHYLSRTISLEQQSCTLIPQDLFDMDNVHDLYPVLGLAKTHYTLHVDEVSQENIVVVSGVKNEDNHHIQTSFSREKPVASATAFLNAVLASCINEQRTLYINLIGKKAEFIYISDGQLIFISQFPNNDADEFNYFLLSCAKELNINLEETAISLSGNVTDGDEFHARCTKYSKDVRFSSANIFLDEAIPANLSEPHRFFSLFGLTLCV